MVRVQIMARLRMQREEVVMFKLKRAYEEPERSDGFRVLVERLWPRGVSGEKAALDLWMKDIAPSPDLRAWYAHDPAKFEEFRKRYREELHRQQELIDDLLRRGAQGTVTLVYAASDEERNSAVVLKAVLERQAARHFRRPASARTRVLSRRPRTRRKRMRVAA